MRSICLMYHCIYENSPSESGFQNPAAKVYKITRQAFERQLAVISTHIVIGDISEIRITVDDGGLSCYTVIAPLLEKYGLKGWFFIPTATIGTPGFMNAMQIRDLHGRGHSIGTHSHTHPVNMTDCNIEELFREWEDSMAILKEITGNEITCASVPNGISSPKIEQAAMQCGIRELFDSTPDIRCRQKSGLRIYGRYVLLSDTSERKLEQILSSPAIRLGLHLRWSLLKQLRKILGNKYYLLRRILVSGAR